MSNMKTIQGVRSYSLKKLISCGSYGKVYQDYPYAIKQIKYPSHIHSSSLLHFKQNLSTQIKILQNLNHQNVVRLFEVIYQHNCVYLVMELCQADLKMMTINKAQGEKTAIKIMKDVLIGYKQIDKLKLVHRDLKPANILCKNGVFKLADFGFAKDMHATQNDMLQSHVGTPFYMAPQILQKDAYTKKCDIWSLGIIFYQLVYGHLPWDGSNEIALLGSILKKPLAFNCRMSVSCQTKDLISMMLSIKQSQRPCMQQIQKRFQLLCFKLIPQPSIPKIIHRSTIIQMLSIQKQRISKEQFKKSYSELDYEQTNHVKKLVEGSFLKEYLYVVRDVLKEDQSKLRKNSKHQSQPHIKTKKNQLKSKLNVI